LWAVTVSHWQIGSFLLLAWVTQFDGFDVVYLFGVDDQFGVERVQFLRFLEILGSCVVVLQGFVREGSTEVGVAVFRLQTNHF
jgi:hypothetical protein